MNRTRLLLAALAVLPLSCSRPPGRTAADVDPNAIELRVAPDQGARFRFRLTVDVETNGRYLHTVSSGALVAGSHSADGTVLTQEIVGSSLDLLDEAVDLPTSSTGLAGAQIRGRVDDRGELRGSVDVDGVPEQLRQMLRGFVWGAVSLPPGPIAPGDSYDAIPRWAFAALAGQMEQTDEVPHRLEGVEGDFAEIVIDGETTGTSEVAEGIELRGTFDLDGRYRVSTRDGLRGRGTGIGEIEWEVSGERARGVDPYAFFPRRVGVEWCVYREGDEPSTVGCAEEAPFALGDVPRARRVARVFEGDACAARVAQVGERLRPVAETAPQLRHDGRVTLPNGTGQSEEARAGKLVITAERIVLQDETMTDVAALRAKLLESLGEGTSRSSLFLFAPADLPAARVAEVLTGVPDRVDLKLAVAGAASAGFVVPEGTPEPLAAELRAMAEAATRGDGGMELGQAFERSMGTCVPLAMRFGQIATSPPEQKRSLLAGLGQDIERCQCAGLDVDAVEGLALLLVMGTPSFEWIPFPVAAATGATGARTVRLPRGATVQALADAVARAGGERPIRLVVPR